MFQNSLLDFDQDERGFQIAMYIALIVGDETGGVDTRIDEEYRGCSLLVVKQDYSV